MKIHIALCMLISIIPSVLCAATSNVTKIGFTTDARGVAIGEISEAITVQMQNAAGEEEKLDSTADAVFTSSSATGEFLGGTGKAVTKTVNSGSANKTFYYRDSTEGIHVITVTITPRAGGAGWTATQNIYVGVDAPTGEDDDDENDEEKTDGGKSDSSSGSSHSSSKKLSTYKKSQTFKMSAGRDRTVMVNSPIHFEAETNDGVRAQDRSIKYVWSYGDGDSDGGVKAKHVYYFPGEYNVVLTAYDGKDESVSRIKVKVLDSALSISEIVGGAGGYVEIKNTASSEANINGWWIRNNEHEYLISGDTIINAKSNLRIPNKILGFDPGQEMTIGFPTKETALAYETKKEEAVPIATVSKEEQDQAMAYYYANFAHEVDPDQVALPADPIEPVAIGEGTESKVATTVEKQTAAVAEAIEVPSSKGFWGFVRGLFSVE